MDDAAKLEKFVHQCKSNDVDVKVDALTKIQAEFERGIEIIDTDSIIATFKACLRTQNMHLSTAALGALVPAISALVSRQIHHRPTDHPTTSSPSAASSTSSTASTSMVDNVALRQVLNAFLPPGGVFDRLGDREKPQLKAREVLVLLGGFAFRASSASSAVKARRDQGPETALQIFERNLRELGLASKGWKVREQSILALVQIRRAHHLFPIRPYLPQLVDCLEDTDAHVRETARQSIVELFTGPGVTDAARADLKKEMTKKGVRKGIVDGVLGQLLSSSTSSSLPQSDGSENGDFMAPVNFAAATNNAARPGGLSSSQSRRPTVGSIPTRTLSGAIPKELSRPASRAAETPPPTPVSETIDVRPVYIASARDLENEFMAMTKHFEGKETEHNWSSREQSILRVRGMLKGDVHVRYSETFLGCLKEFLHQSQKTLISLRTTVCSNTCSLYSELALALGHYLDPHCEYLVTQLLKLANFTKKIAASQSQAAVTTIISNVSAQPRIILPLLSSVLQEKSVQARGYAIAHVKQYLEIHAQPARAAIDASGGTDILDRSIKKSLADPNPGVKEMARTCFWLFHNIWPDRADVILGSLDGLARKQLEKVCPDSDTAALVITPTAPSTAKKSSVAAAIAASRAKAKAIASAPPTLRHQATSTSHAVRAISPPLQKRAASPTSTSPRPISPLRQSSSSSYSAGGPSSPKSRSRIVSSGSMKGVPASSSPPSSFSSSTHGHHPVPPVFTARKSVDAGSSSPPPSPPHSTFKRRISSPLAPSHTTHNSRPTSLQLAMETALPASPPSSSLRISQMASTPVPGTTRAAAANLNRISVGRGSLLFPEMNGGVEDDLLLASAIPIPEDSDDESLSHNPLSFSAAFERYPPGTTAKSNSPRSIPSITPRKPTASGSQAPSSPTSNELNRGDLASNSLSNSFADMSISSVTTVGGGSGQPVVEDALRARAEQAESAAERLLELVEPEDDATNGGIPQGLLAGTSAQFSSPASSPQHGPVTPRRYHTTPPQQKQGGARNHFFTPMTPNTAAKEVMKRAAAFQNSPVRNNGMASKPPAPGVMDVLRERRLETAWWMKRMAVIERSEPLAPADAESRAVEIREYISLLEAGTADKEVLRKLILISVENIVTEPNPTSASSTAFPGSPSPFSGPSQSLTNIAATLWDRDKTFGRLFRALIGYLTPSRPEEENEYGLILLWELTENQSTYVDGREAEIFSVLLTVRSCNKVNVLEATTMIRDAFTTRIEPVYGLTTMHASLRAFMTQPLVSTPADVRYSTCAFGLVALGRFILRLPAEVAEDELPRLKNTLISSLNESHSLVVREAAAACIIGAQLVLRDETQLFALLDGLADDKKNLLTYLFDKHSIRNLPVRTSFGGATAIAEDSRLMEKVEKELRRVDTRTSMPPKPQLGSP